MSKVGQLERVTQNRVLQLMRDRLDWTCLGNWGDREGNSNVEEEYLTAFLAKQGYSDSLIKRAVFEIKKAAGDQSRSLYEVNKEVYGMLRYGVKVREEVGENKETVWLINWEEPLSNHFAIAEEVSVQGENKKRPDIVLYVNGIALGVIELKRGTVSVAEGIRQNLDNQKSVFIREFFHTMQLVMAGNDTEGLRYGTIETPEKYYLTWKEKSDESFDHLLDKHLVQFCNKERFLEIIHEFTLFDAGTKKICRPHQYFGVKESQSYINRREGGIIWHTQGSGKSLTMVWMAKWIRENINNSRVVIITDRDELDKQIVRVFRDAGEEMTQAKSGAHLIDRLNRNEDPLLCSLIHKFGTREEGDYASYIEEIRKSLPKEFKAKGDIYVFVDECHRTQSGILHEAMKSILPDALFIGFTGTPLLKKDKKTSLEVFGKYIHTYKFDEAVQDKVVLDLQYEARDVDQHITNQQSIDEWFDAETRGLTDVARVELKKRWGTMRKILSSKSRLEKIVFDVLKDFKVKPRLCTGEGNALLVAGSVYEACKYYELFQAVGFRECAIVTSYEPSAARIKGEETGAGATEELHKHDIYKKMIGKKSTEEFEAEVKRQFIHEPARMKLLIVVDKLLTGFDAPPATYLYIDKSMQDHGLFQAICRVNRLDSEDKDFGYIIDYKDLFKSLENSIHDYTSEAFGQYEKDDVDGLLKDRLELSRSRLEDAMEACETLCEPVHPKDSVSFIRYFCGDPENEHALKETEEKRVVLYKQVVALIRGYANIANEMPRAGYSSEQAERIKERVTFFTNLRDEIKKASGDYIDLKAYEPGMRQLIDMYISADSSRKISAFDDLSLIDLIVERGTDAVEGLPDGIRKDKEAVAETIENNLRKVIIEERPTNPKYFERMSHLLDELIQDRRVDAMAYEEYLKRVVELTQLVKKPEMSDAYPSSLNTPAKRALYDNLDQNEELTTAADEAVRYVKKDGWRGNRIKEREVKNAVKKVLPDNYDIDNIFEIIRNQDEY
ncbi:MAG: HsdR family type I site-specific deoxyribonuclease [Flavobacteriales bacterium]|nr:HsdR family type I site-specific deoxyribonuclease [Flavobacteriales bacterium]